MQQNNIEIEELTKCIVGLTLEQARSKYENYIFRATYIDGQSLFVEDDFRPSRINVKLVNGVITEFDDRY